MGAMGQGPEAPWPPVGGEYTREKARSDRSPSGGGSPGVVLPRMAPLILGLPGFAGSIPGRYSTDFLPIYMDFLGRLFLVIERVLST